MLIDASRCSASTLSEVEWVDTHAHLNFHAFSDDADDVIRRSLNGGIFMINVGSKYPTSKRAVELAENYQKGVYAAVGLHPIHVVKGILKFKTDAEETQNDQEEKFKISEYKKLALSSKKVVAIGEIGLDYYYRPKTKIKLKELKERQREVFEKQLELANELNFPVIFHCRMAHEDLLETLNQKLKTTNYKLLGVIHCFTGTWEQAKRYLEMGFYLGFNGIIFKLDLDEVIEKTPLERILIETDCPYLTPPLDFGLRQSDAIRNEPLYVKYIAEQIAKMRKISYKEISEITTKNARKLFKI